MARINSRTKGQKGEKMAIAFLASWTKLEFARTPSSGGLRWKKAENIAGDIVCTSKNKLFPLSIEVKFTRDINFEHLLYHKANKKEKRLVSRIEEYWMQAKSDAARAEKIPILLMRYNNMPKDFFFVMISRTFYDVIVYEQADHIKPFLMYSKGVVLTTSLALGKVNFKIVDEAAWTLINNRYGEGTK